MQNLFFLIGATFIGIGLLTGTKNADTNSVPTSEKPEKPKKPKKVKAARVESSEEEPPVVEPDKSTKEE